MSPLLLATFLLATDLPPDAGFAPNHLFVVGSHAGVVEFEDISIPWTLNYNEVFYVLEGEMRYRHGKKLYDLKPGDSLFFDAEATHGPEALVRLPVRMIAVLSKPREEG